MKASTKKTTRKARPSKGNRQPPDLTKLFYEFEDARALVTVATQALENSDYSGPEISVLSVARQSLERLADQMDEAEALLGGCRRKRDTS
jgi:hypothetical protein